MRITNAEMKTAFAALVHAYGHAGITQEIAWHDQSQKTDEHGTYVATSADLILSEGSATYGNAWGVWISPWHNGARFDGASAHYAPRGLGSLSTDRREALARMRSYTAGIYAAMSAQVSA